MVGKSLAAVSELFLLGLPVAAQARTRTTVGIIRVTGATGTVQVKFASDCGAFGRCGLSGTETYTASAGASSEALLIHARVRKQTLTTGQLGLSDGVASASVALPGTPVPCIDTSTLQPLELMLADGGRGKVAIKLSAGTRAKPAPDIFDNHCPGPRLLDAVNGTTTTLASMPLAEFARRALSLSLNSSSPFNGAGFAGTVTSNLHADLRRLKLGKSIRRLLVSLLGG